MWKDPREKTEKPLKTQCERSEWKQTERRLSMENLREERSERGSSMEEPREKATGRGSDVERPEGENRKAT
jgi:hypothetical protein